MEETWDESKDADLEERVQRTYYKGREDDIHHSDIVENILELAGENWKEAKKYIPIYEYEDDDPRKGCNVDDYGIAIDPFTLVEIPKNKIISFMEEGTRWCFNIESLAEYIRRGKPINPTTRRPLSDDVIRELQEFEMREKSITISILDPGTNESRTMTSVKGTPFIEIAMDALRTCESCERDSILIRVLDYTVLNLRDNIDFEEEITEDTKLEILYANPTNIKYFGLLQKSCSKRYSLQAISNAVSQHIETIILTIPVIDLLLYLSSQEGHDNMFYVTVIVQRRRSRDEGRTDSSIYNFLNTTLDYGKSLENLLSGGGIVKLKYAKGVDAFLGLFNFPNDFDSGDTGIIKMIENTYKFYVREAIKNKDIQIVNNLLSLEIPPNIDILQEIIDGFDPKDIEEIIYELEYKDFVQLEFTEEYIKSGYYANYFSKFLYDGEDRGHLMNLITRVKLGETPKMTLLEQAVVIAMIGDGKLYLKYKDTFNFNYFVLYDNIWKRGRLDDDPIVSLFDQRHFIEYSLFIGDVDTAKIRTLEKELSLEILEEFIRYTRKIDPYSFSHIFLDSGFIKHTEVYPLILRTKDVEYNLHSILEAVATNYHENVANTPFTLKYINELYCDVIADKDIDQEIKLKVFVKILKNLGKETKVSKNIRECFGFKLCLEMFRISNEPKSLPDLSDREIVNMANNDRKLMYYATDLGAIGQDELIKVLSDTHENIILDYLTYESLETLKKPYIVIEWFTKGGKKKVINQNALKYIKSNKNAQVALVDLIDEKKLSLPDVNSLSILGIIEMVERGWSVDLSNVYNVFQFVEINEDIIRAITNSNYLKEMYINKIEQ